ncbi:NUDIX hydrolase [Methylobacter sp. G7]|uniref:NUDIX domain-containing protein n=1 Tax=Methylobacter sp. G7 TaxID=3230117 RepID=UPI003D803472
MSANLIQTLISHLPLYAEEEGDFYSVPRKALIIALCRQHQLERAIAENTVNVIEALLDTLAVLNAAYLQKDEWCFVSFPAQLLATSLLTAMSDNESRFFADNFWNTQGIADAKKNQQREVLSVVENRRYEHHSIHNAKPIRYIYVAWGIIKLDGNILFYQREDTQKRFDKKAGDYGLIGGRLNQHDVPGDMDMPVLLVELQSANSALIKQALPETLKREISEEVGLVFEQHYRFKPWRSLKPYRQVQGSAPNHALTEYYLDIFQIELTLEGYLFLQQQIKHDDRLVWFAIDDVAKGESVDGKIAYIKALVDDFDKDRLTLKIELLALPDSFAAGYLFDQPKSKYGLTLLIDAEKPLWVGALGKEKPLDVALTSRQLSVLLGLAAHGRGFEFATIEQNIIFHPYGWIDVKNNPTLQAELNQLAELFKGTDLIIENHHDVLFRLSINPDVVYFDETLFTYSVHKADLIGTKTKIPVSIERKAFATALGMTQVKAEAFKLPRGLAKQLQRLSEKQFGSHEEEGVRIEDAYKKGLHREPKFLALGLRGLIRREVGVIKFCCKLDVL